MSNIQPDSLTLENIQKLQKVENDLFYNLDANKNTLSLAQKNDIVSKINELVYTRMNLYKGLNSINNSYQNNLVNTGITLDNQILAVNAIEDQLNESKKRLQLIEEEKMNKLRLIEINSYYGKKYKDQVNLLKITTYVFIVIFVLTVFLKVQLIPSGLYYFLFIIIVFLYIVVCFHRILKMYNRDNMNYDEYNWKFDSKKAPKPPTSDISMKIDPWAIKTPSFNYCVGELCCSDNTTWDGTKGVCVVNSIAASSAAPVSIDTPNDSSTDILFSVDKLIATETSAPDATDTPSATIDNFDTISNSRKNGGCNPDVLNIFERPGYTTTNSSPDVSLGRGKFQPYNV